MLSPEIAKLTEKLAKDPSSKLFVPLAEEYLKSEMADEAMSVLLDGLKVHPAFHTARVALGKVYLQKGLVAEAKAEFERVVAAVPDNIFCHRKLARLHMAAGDLEKARTSCRAVLMQYAKDKEMLDLMAEVEKAAQKPVPQAPVELSKPPQGVSALEPEPAVMEAAVEPPASEPVALPPASAEEKPVRKVGTTETMTLETSLESVPEQEIAMPVNSSVVEVKSVPSEQPPVLQEENSRSEPGTTMYVEAALDSPTAIEAALSLESESAAETAVETPAPPAVQEPAPPVLEAQAAPGSPVAEASAPPPQRIEPPQTFEGAETVVMKIEPPPAEAEATQIQTEIVTESLAELYIQQGLMDRGVEVYRKLVQAHPDQMRFKARFEELSRRLLARQEASHGSAGPSAEPPQIPEMAAPAAQEAQAENPQKPVQPEGSMKDMKIQRLQSWLDSLKKQSR
jgi:tetratricopeptide (TPR) repeat protein